MASSAQPRQTALDLLRLVSAFLVLLFHYGFRMGISGEGGGIGFPELQPVAMWGSAGLLVFFAISGYVIALSAEDRSAFDFAAGRLARLWPAFIVCSTITAIVVSAWPIPGVPHPTIVQWLAQSIIVSRLVGQPFMDGAYWTITYEIVFYSWVALLMAAGLFKRWWSVALLIWLAISVANEAWLHSGAVRKLLITEYSGYFAFGMALYKAHKDFSRTTLALLGLSLLWATLSQLVIEPYVVTTYGVVRNPLGVLLLGPATLGLVAVTASIGSVPVPPKLAIGLGALTYPLYLLHQHIGYATFARFGTPENKWMVGAALIAALCFASYLVSVFIERPGRRLILKAVGGARTIATAQSATTGSLRSSSGAVTPD